MSVSTSVQSVASRPIPALYTVYVLRSTMRHASVYIGSTTDPPRRLKQHNGAIRGGAARTARASLRPWEMVALVSGFPGSVAALQFEWALTNPHLSLHIPSGSRLTVARLKKKNGHPRRPPAGLQSIVANLHLLLRVPSFARWPLRLHMFSPDVQKVWQAWCAAGGAAAAGATPPPIVHNQPIDVVTDFGPAAAPAAASESQDSSGVRPWGIHALPLDYTPLRNYVDKARDIFAFERADDCVLCREHLPQDGGLYAVCPNDACEATGHLRCWSEHLLSTETSETTGAAAVTASNSGAGTTNENAVIIPLKGHCPQCHEPVRWVDMMKELTLRLRAPKEVAKLVKAKRREKKAALAAEKRAMARKTAKKAGVVLDSEDDDFMDDSGDLGDITDGTNDADDADSIGALSDSSNSTGRVATTRRAKKTTAAGTKKAPKAAKAAKVSGATYVRKTVKASPAPARAQPRARSSSPEIVVL